LWVFSLIASPMIALVAVIVGPLIQLRKAKKANSFSDRIRRPAGMDKHAA
jgi:hypothetical protein